MTTKQDRHILIAIIALSVLLRVVVALFLGNAIEETRGGTFDQISYDALALRVAGGHGFSFGTAWWPGVQADQPTAFWSYLYTLYLAVVYTLFGHAPLIARLIQAVIVGAAMPWLTWRIGGRIFGRRPALIAAAISAVYFYFILYAASLMSEALYIVGVLWTVDAAMRLAAALGDAGASAGRRWRLGLELGLAMGVTLLLRQAIAPFLAVLALWFLWLAWRRGWLRRALGPLAAAALLMALLLLPFVVRNYRAFGVVGMPNTNVGINFFWANHPIYGTQFEAVLSPEHGISYQELIPPELRGLNDALLDRALLDRGVQIVLDDPGRYLLLSLSRIPIYFQFWPTPQSSLLSNAARLLSFGLFLPFMLYGLVLALVDARRGRFTAGADHPGSASEPSGEPTQDLRLAYLSLVLCFMAIYTLVHIASWANVRYRLPVDAFWILFAGYAIDNLLHRLSNRRAHSPSPINHSPIHHSPINHSPSPN
jgi:4-amino-4-deoxy-L-arabinose transferase-like glycosyltransferase